MGAVKVAPRKILLASCERAVPPLPKIPASWPRTSTGFQDASSLAEGARRINHVVHDDNVRVFDAPHEIHLVHLKHEGTYRQPPLSVPHHTTITPPTADLRLPLHRSKRRRSPPKYTNQRSANKLEPIGSFEPGLGPPGPRATRRNPSQWPNVHANQHTHERLWEQWQHEGASPPTSAMHATPRAPTLSRRRQSSTAGKARDEI